MKDILKEKKITVNSTPTAIQGSIVRVEVE